MRYLIWLGVVLGDLSVAFACYVIANSIWHHEQSSLWILVLVIVGWLWIGTGSLDAWRPTKVKVWLEQAKKRGL